MTRWMTAVAAGLIACSTLAPSLARAQSEMPPELVEASKRPGGAEILRRAKAEDRRQVAAINRAQARDTADRDRSSLRDRDAVNDRAQARYREELAAWHRQVDACRGGDWSQCER